MNFNFNGSGTPVAIITGGKYDKKKLISLDSDIKDIDQTIFSNKNENI